MRVVVVVVVFFVWVIVANIRTVSKFFIGLLLLLTTTSLYIHASRAFATPSSARPSPPLNRRCSHRNTIISTMSSIIIVQRRHSIECDLFFSVSLFFSQRSNKKKTFFKLHNLKHKKNEHIKRYERNERNEVSKSSSCQVRS